MPRVPPTMIATLPSSLMASLTVRDDDLAERRRALVVTVGIDRVIEREHLVDYRGEPVCLDRAVHRLEMAAAADRDRTQGETLRPEGLWVDRGQALVACEKTDEGDLTLHAQRFDGRCELTDGLDHVVDADTAGELAHPHGPVGRLAVVDDLVRAELAQPLGLLL